MLTAPTPSFGLYSKFPIAFQHIDSGIPMSDSGSAVPECRYVSPRNSATMEQMPRWCTCTAVSQGSLAISTSIGCTSSEVVSALFETTCRAHSIRAHNSQCFYHTGIYAYLLEIFLAWAVMVLGVCCVVRHSLCAASTAQYHVCDMMALRPL